MPKALPVLLLLALTLVTVSAQQPTPPDPSTQAQPAPSGELVDIRFEGISDPSLERLMRVRLSARPGTPVDEVVANLESERNALLASGVFSAVSLSVEARPVGAVLFVRVQEYPPIARVTLEGAVSLDNAAVLGVLNEQHLIREGQVYNTVRAQEATATLQAIYQQAGYPGRVPVTLTVRPYDPERIAQEVAAQAEAEGELPERSPAAREEVEGAASLELIYTVTESPPLDAILFQGATVLPEERLSDIFAPLAGLDTFNLQAYARASEGVAEAYDALGFQGSGVDTQESALEGGTLRVQLRELEILSLDTTAIGVNPGELSLQPGDLFNYDTLLRDVQRLAQGRSADIRLEAEPTASGVRVVFLSGPPDSAGPIERVEIAGNTVFSDAELRAQLELEPGQTFTSALAQEDFARLAAFYAAAGYQLAAQPDFDFEDGTYVQRLREVKIAGYEVDLQTEEGAAPRTQESVITRYLPEVGSVYNQREVELGILRIGQLQILQLAQVGDRVGHALIPTDTPGEAVVRFIAQETPSRTLRPAAELTTEGGVSFGTDFAVSDTNLFGEAHRASASLSARTSDIGFLVGGSVAYTVPWLYLDVLDFQEVATEVSGELFSEAQSNQPLSEGGATEACLGGGSDCDEAARVRIGEYTERDTGFRFGVGRPVAPSLTANLSARFTQTSYYLEPAEEVCGAAPSETCALPGEQAQAFVPQSGFSSFLGSSLAYDTRDNPQFAREGVRLTVGGGVGFGTDFRDAAGVQQRYQYEQLEVGARTYVTPFDDEAHVFAFRIGAGHQFGAFYPDSRLFIVGDTNNEATQVRGYRRTDIGPSRSYAAATAEYRYDFGLSTAVTQTVVGIGFVDLGYASSVPGFEDYDTPLLPSVGAALQLNIGFGGGLALPPLRFDYGFSPKNPTGVFGFRLGFNF